MTNYPIGTLVRAGKQNHLWQRPDLAERHGYVYVIVAVDERGGYPDYQLKSIASGEIDEMWWGLTAPVIWEVIRDD